VQLVIFYLYLIFYACGTRFNVTRNLKFFTIFLRTKQGLRYYCSIPSLHYITWCFDDMYWITFVISKNPSEFRSCLDQKGFGFWRYSIFIFIWQTLSNYGVTRLKRFVSRFTCKLCNYFLFSFIFNTPCMCRKIWCDGESWKVFGFRNELNKALICLYFHIEASCSCLDVAGFTSIHIYWSGLG